MHDQQYTYTSVCGCNLTSPCCVLMVLTLYQSEKQLHKVDIWTVANKKVDACNIRKYTAFAMQVMDAQLYLTPAVEKMTTMEEDSETTSFLHVHFK